MDVWVYDQYRVISFWIIKGTFIGLWLFSYATIAYFVLKGFIPRPGTTIDARTVLFLTVSNPSWWLGLVASLAIGLMIARAWHIRPVVWAALIFSGLFPAVLFTIFVVILGKLKQAAGQ